MFLFGRFGFVFADIVKCGDFFLQAFRDLFPVFQCFFDFAIGQHPGFYFFDLFLKIRDFLVKRHFLGIDHFILMRQFLLSHVVLVELAGRFSIPPSFVKGQAAFGKPADDSKSIFRRILGKCMQSSRPGESSTE